MVLFVPIGGAPLPTLSDPLASLSVLPVAAWSEAVTDGPSRGAAPGPPGYSDGLSELKGNAAAKSPVAAIFDSRSSPCRASNDGPAGPLTVGRACAADSG